MLAGPIGDRATAEIHERLWLLQPDMAAAKAALPKVAVCGMQRAVIAARQLSAKPIKNHEADVMARVRILWARISQAYNEIDVLVCRNRFPSP